jgi:hypothetical protein
MREIASKGLATVCGVGRDRSDVGVCFVNAARDFTNLDQGSRAGKYSDGAAQLAD